MIRTILHLLKSSCFYHQIWVENAGRLLIIDSFKSPGKNPTGLAFDGVYLWHCDAETGRLYKIDIKTKNILQEHEIGLHLWGLTINSRHLWFSDDLAHIIGQFDPQTGAILRKFYYPNADIHGLAWDGKYLWCIDWIGKSLWKLDPSCGEILHRFPTPCMDPAGLAFDGYYFWISDSTRPLIFKLDLKSRKVVSYKAVGMHQHDLCWINNMLLLSARDCRKIYFLLPHPQATVSKALVHGYFGMGNVGDEAVLSALIKELKSRHIQPVILSRDPNLQPKLHNTPSCYDRLLSLGFWRNFLQSSMLVFTGGRYGQGTMRRMCVLAIFAKALGKKVEFKALGIYPYEWIGIPVIASTPIPFSNLLTRALIKIAFTLAGKVTVRDEFSKHVLIASGVTKEVGIEEDLAFNLDVSSLENSLRILLRHDVDVSRRPLIGVNLRTLHSEVRQELINIISDFLDWLIMRGAELVFIPFGYGSTTNRFFDDDLIIVKELKKHMKNGSNLKVIDTEYTPQEILGIFRFFDLFIGMRFHSIVFSMMNETPTIALIYDTKTVELLKKRGDKCCCISIMINELNVDNLKKATDALQGRKFTKSA